MQLLSAVDKIRKESVNTIMTYNFNDLKNKNTVVTGGAAELVRNCRRCCLSVQTCRSTGQQGKERQTLSK